MSVRTKLQSKKTKLAKPRTAVEDHPASLNNFENGSFCTIEIKEIHPDPLQPRKFFDEEALRELSASIRQKGVLQPVIIRRDESGKIWLVAGERRYRAAKMAGLDKMPAVVTTGNPAEIALIENLQRDDLRPIEEAEALSRMMSEYNYTQEQLADIVGKGRSTITELLTLTKLPEKVKEECRTSDIPKNVLLEIAKRQNPEEMEELYIRAKEFNFTVAAIRALTRKQTKNPVAAYDEIVIRKLIDFKKSIQKLHLSDMSMEKRQQLSDEFKEVYEIINTLFLEASD